MMLAEGTSTDSIVSPIQQAGNYFVMDSEQVVSNPYQDLQTEALDSVKKVSLTERLTAVRNNVCEHNLREATKHLEKQSKHSMRSLHVDKSNMRYEAKVMDINKRRNDLMMQQRIEPEKDYSYDSRQINNSAKRLGMTNERSFYLDKELQHPLRGTIYKDHNAKPFIKKAKKTLQDRCIQKKIQRREMERVQTANTMERTPTAQSLSTSIEIPSPEPSTKGPSHTRAGSKSAPPQKGIRDLHNTVSRSSGFDDTESKLPSISTTQKTSKSHVKFEEPSLFQQSSGLQRSKTFTSGVPPTRTYRREAWDSDSDDDYLYCDKVDLRALFFGDKTQNTDSKSAASGTTTPRTSCTRMSSEIPPVMRAKSAQPVKEEQIIKENQELRKKIDNFLGTIPDDEKVPKKEDKDKENEKKEKEKKEEEEKRREEIGKSRMSAAAKAAYILNVFSKPMDRRAGGWGGMYRPPTHQEANYATQAEVDDQDNEDDIPKKKELWEFIKTNVQNGNIRKKYTANDLLLQQLTGILVRSDRKTVIPIHSASRALRHTPTFKMRRVIEEWMRQRTRYEQQEIEKLQQQEENGDSQGGGAPVEEDQLGGPQLHESQTWATQSRPISQAMK